MCADKSEAVQEQEQGQESGGDGAVPGDLSEARRKYGAHAMHIAGLMRCNEDYIARLNGGVVPEDLSEARRKYEAHAMHIQGQMRNDEANIARPNGGVVRQDAGPASAGKHKPPAPEDSPGMHSVTCTWAVLGACCVCQHAVWSGRSGSCTGDTADAEVQEMVQLLSRGGTAMCHRH